MSSAIANWNLLTYFLGDFIYIRVFYGEIAHRPLVLLPALQSERRLLQPPRAVDRLAPTAPASIGGLSEMQSLESIAAIAQKPMMFHQIRRTGTTDHSSPALTSLTVCPRPTSGAHPCVDSRNAEKWTRGVVDEWVGDVRRMEGVAGAAGVA